MVVGPGGSGSKRPWRLRLEKALEAQARKGPGGSGSKRLRSLRLRRFRPWRLRLWRLRLKKALGDCKNPPLDSYFCCMPL